MQRKSCKIDEKILLDWGVKIGAAAKRENIRSSQLENIITTLEAFADPKACLLGVAAYAFRQVQRLKKRSSITAKLIGRAMLQLYQSGCGKKEACKVLRFAKWVYEALPQNYPIPGRLEDLTLEKLIEHLARAR